MTAVLTLKRCTKCDKTKPIDAFGRDSKSPDGKNYWCRECARAASRAQYTADPEKARAARRTSYAKYPERRREASQEWRVANPTRKAASDVAYREANREKRREATRSYAARNPEKVAIARRVADHARRARERSAYREHVDPSTVFARDGWVCGICGQSIEPTLRFPHPKAASIDHVVPLARGGLHAYANVQAAHFDCNVAKRDRIETVLN